MALASNAPLYRPEQKYPQRDFAGDKPCCEAVHAAGWFCTRSVNHPPPHEAAGTDQLVIAAWSDRYAFVGRRR